MLKGNKKPLLVLPTGGGKTAIASELVRRSHNKGKSSIFICHRQELLRQTYKTYQKNGIIPAIIKGGIVPDYNNPMQVASVNTLVRRLDQYRKPDIVFWDECFVGDTKIATIKGNKRIKDVKAGDYVYTFNESKHVIECKKVIKSIKKENKEKLLSIKVNGKNIICTENHLFYTKRGWTKAKNLCILDMVLNITSNKGDYNEWNMRKMREYCGTNTVKKSSQKKNRYVALYKMHRRKTEKNIFGNYGKNEQNICLRENEIKQSYEEKRSKRKSVNNIEGYEVETAKKRWKRNRSYCCTNAFSFCTRLEYGSGYKNRSLQRWKRLSSLLQSRYSKRSVKNSYRSGWRKPLISHNKREGQKENRFSCWSRLEGVKVHEQRGYKRPTEVCGRSFVYDLTVEDNHNYFAEGVLVHNCHHIASSTWKTIAEYYKDSVHIGLTATPCRLDGKPLDTAFDDMIEVINTKQLIEQGYLSPYQYYAPSSIDASELAMSSNGDYSKESLAQASFSARIVGDNIQQYIKLANGKRNIVFAINRIHGMDITRRYKEAGISAEFLDGETPDKKRRDVVNAFEEGKINVLVNCDLFGEGFDLPAVEVVSLLRPTASTSLYLQQVGRGLRTCKEIGKTHALILDHVNNWQRHGLPDEVREWSLNTGLTKRKRNASSSIAIRRCPRCFFAHSPALCCPNCGYKYQADGKEIKEIAGELVLLGTEQARQQQKKEVIIADNLKELVRIEKDRGLKTFWAEKQWQLKTGENLWGSLNGLEKIAEARGYSNGWAWVRWNKRSRK